MTAITNQEAELQHWLTDLEIQIANGGGTH
jgi:hypothetical protein